MATQDCLPRCSRYKIAKGKKFFASGAFGAALLAATALHCPLAAAQVANTLPATSRANLLRSRQEWFYKQRAYPLKHIPPGARLKALKQLDRLMAAQAAQRGAPRLSSDPVVPSVPAAQWSLKGPQPTIPQPDLPFGGAPTVAGRVSALAVDQRDANVVYLGAAQGGVWKTRDGGLTWIPLTDTQASLAIGSIALAVC